MSSEDSAIEKQITEANKLGNALLSGLIADGISENKRNVKIFGNLKTLRDLIETYKSEVEKLKSLQIGACSDVVSLKDNSMYQVQIGVAGKLLKKIDDILKVHVKHNASHVISKVDIKNLEDQMSLIDSMQQQLAKLPESRDDLKQHLRTIDEIEMNLENITTSIEATKSKVDHLQLGAVTESADVLYFSI